MEDKRLPSREEVLELRRQGKVPWSRASVCCITLAGVAGVPLWYLSTPHEGHALQRLFLTAIEEPISCITLGMAMVIITSVVSLACGLLISMIQTRFFVTSRLFVLWPEHGFRTSGSGRALAGIVIGGTCAFFLAYRYIPTLFTLLMRGTGSLEQDLTLLGSDLVWVLVVGALFLAILSAVATRYLFRWNNRVASGNRNSTSI